MTVTKAELRCQLRARHPGQAERDRQSALICRHILLSEAFRRARVIGGYVPLLREADVTQVLQETLACGKVLALPRCGCPPEMTLHRVTDLRCLVHGPYGLLESAAEMEIIAPDALDLLIVPLEGIDPRGRRLGKGGGYYDRLLAQTDVLTIGTALTSQWAEHIPSDPWDVPLKSCVDEHGIHWFK